MSKLKSFFKRHKGFSIFLIILLILGIARFGAYLYKVQNPNEIYYGADDLCNFKLYEDIRDVDDGNWQLTREPVKLGKIYKSPYSLIPSSTLNGFKNDPEHIFIQDDCPILPLITYMKRKDYDVFDINGIEKIVVEHAKIPGGDLVGYIEFKNLKDFSLWITIIQDVRNNKYEKSDDYGYRTAIHSAYFYLKNVPNARYWVGSINLEDYTIEIPQAGRENKLYALPKELAEMIKNGKEIPITEEPAQ